MRRMQVGVTTLLIIIVSGVTAWQRNSPQSYGVVATVPVDPEPVLAAVDGRRNRAFIINWNFGSNSAATVPTDPGSSTVLNARDGTIVAKATVGVYSLAIAVDERRDRVFVANAYGTNVTSTPTVRGSVSILNAATGTVIHHVNVGYYPTSLAVDDHTDHVFVTDYQSSTVSMLDAHTGQLIRTVLVAHGPSSVAVAQGIDRAFTVNDASVSVLTTRSGTVLRTVPIPSARITSGVVVNDRTRRVIVTGDTSLSILDARTGVLLHTVDLGTAINYVVADGRTNRAFVVSQQTKAMIMLDATTGTVLRTSSLGMRAGAAVVDEREGCVFVGASDRSNHAVVDVLDATSGQVLGVVAVAGDPRAVDEQTGRVFVLNGFGTVSVIDATAFRAKTPMVTSRP